MREEAAWAAWAHDSVVREGQRGPRGTAQFGGARMRTRLSKHKKGKRLLILSFDYASMLFVF